MLLLNAINCTAASIQGIIVCLETAKATFLNKYSSAPRYVAEDSIFVNTTSHRLQSPHNGTAFVLIMFGNAVNDSTSFNNLVPVSPGNLTGVLQQGINTNAAAA